MQVERLFFLPGNFVFSLALHTRRRHLQDEDFMNMHEQTEQPHEKNFTGGSCSGVGGDKHRSWSLTPCKMQCTLSADCSRCLQAF